MPTKDLLDIARCWWWLLVVAALVGGSIGHSVIGRAPSQYTSEVHILVGPLNGNTDSLRASGLLVQTYGALVTADDALRAAARAGGISDNVQLNDVRKSVNVLTNDKTRVLTIDVTLGSAEQARRVASFLTQRLQQAVDDDVARQTALAEKEQAALQNLTRVGRLVETPVVRPPGPESRVTVLDPARAATEPLAPPVLLYSLLAALMSAGAALGLLVLATLRRRRSDLPGLAKLVNRRLLGTCRLNGRRFGSSGSLVVQADWEGHAATDYRLIAAKAELLSASRPLRSLAVFGGRHDTGTAEVAANLALTFARTGRTVALADLALDSPAIVALSVAGGERDVQRVGDYVLETCRLPVGDGAVLAVVSHEPALASADRMSPRALADVLQGVADLVVLHAPPVLLEPTTALVGTQVDGVAVVGAIEAEGAVEGVTDAVDALEGVGAAVLGVILVSGRPVGRPVGPSRRTLAKHPQGRSGDDDVSPVAGSLGPGSGTKRRRQMSSRKAEERR